ncbi:hypothetical protein [Microbacterium sp. Mcb102]|uniref:hypothetical protein n=1 Tax=Microbacterium sp. Mcb102 TaxID=2926012 RepID=UPI0021C6B900|nr:hypothetical protein [Microbacterium sp. Mcb102]
MSSYQHSPIEHDESGGGIVTTCAEHPWWRPFRFYLDDALTAGCRHERDEHPGDYRQRDRYRKRHGVSFPES